jgi:hypothetical protein
MNTTKLYTHHEDPVALGDHYIRHCEAITVEDLHSKSDIAAELAWRDREIERLRLALDVIAARADILRHEGYMQQATAIEDALREASNG